MRFNTHRSNCRQLFAIYGWMICLLSGCQDPVFETLSGQTMGTYYAVQFQSDGRQGERTCNATTAELEAVLEEVNASMSTYRDDSEITQINKSRHAGIIEASSEVLLVLGVAEQLWRRSGGALDVTVGPLVNLWGFGPSDALVTPTEAQQVSEARFVGMDKLSISKSGLQKAHAQVYIDLSALAKGFAVDRLAELLERRGCRNYMVDIGGEIRVAGVNTQQQIWRIGIEVPDPAQISTLQAVVELTNQSIATSGDYRNFRMLDGRRVDHVLDPRTGKPADNNVVSATVLHSSAMWADAYATTLMVLGMDEGMAFAEQEGIAAYMMARKSPQSSQTGSPVSEERFESRYNEAMRAHLPASLDNL